MNERKLASIKKIDALNPIEGADKIEVATVGGWKVVCQKGLYNVGDLVCYFEIDSWIPNEVAPFLTKEGQEPKEYNGMKGERLRTVKLRGVTSQGLLLPLSEVEVFLDRFEIKMPEIKPFEGKDVTELLGIQKYEAPIPACLAGKVKGQFPAWIPKTDEERIQNLTGEWEDLKKYDSWYITEKIDGTSFTCYIKGDEFGVCSRNMDLYEDTSNTHWKFVRAANLEEKMRNFRIEHGNVDFAIQGELIGEGIQKNRYGLKGQRVHVFNVYNITDQSFFGWVSSLEICKTFDIEHVPILYPTMTTIPFTDSEGNVYETVEDVLKYAEGKSTLNPNTEREGVVFKTYAREKSFKAISNKFLLKDS